MEGFVRLKNENTVGKIHFFHPKGNNLPTTIIKSLIDCLQKAEKDPALPLPDTKIPTFNTITLFTNTLYIYFAKLIHN